MARATRSGAQFSPYELDGIRINGRRCEIVCTAVSLDAVLAEAIAAADRREAQLDAEGDVAAQQDDEWEDVDILSRPPSPLSSTLSSAPTSRSCSPPPTASSSSARPPPPAASSSCGAHQRSHPSQFEAEHKRRGAAARRSARNRKRAAKSPYEFAPDMRYSQDYREQSPHSVDFDAAELPRSGGGAWVGPRSTTSRRFYTLPELLEDGYEYVEWNGRDPKLILDSEGRIIAILLGTPDDPDWADIIKEAVQELRPGVSFGGGQRRPGNLRNSRRIRRMLRRLLRSKAIRRIMGFQFTGLAMYAPKLFKYYCPTQYSLLPPSIAAQTHSPSNHCDIHNLSHGFCGVTSGGEFDHKRGGHLYLKQIHLVIEFPSGGSMLIPSGCVNHGNTPIAPKETRHSLTQYAAGGLFRWAAYGFQTAKALLATEGGQEAKERFDGVPGARWSWAMGLFSKVDELEADRAAAFPVDA
ncbi:hypothetical protein C8R43DRAFT_1121165 [Mycena crocata]|nr:hypothetical protein C8R43DRAFT_1121165 [Mycena crocata]